MEKVKLFKNTNQEIALLKKYITEKAKDGTELQILEAGCGRYWPLNINGIQYKLTGVDLDKKALNHRREKFNDLSEIIIGDLRSINLEKNKYDVIYNSFVLEHIDNAETVLKNFIKWLKPGGLLILRIPDRYTVYGFIARFTPFWFHVFYKKYIRSNKNAGKPGFGPYPTYYKPVISRAGIKKFCERNNLMVKEEYGHRYYIKKQTVIQKWIILLVRSLNLLSFGKLAWEHVDLTYIIKNDN